MMFGLMAAHALAANGARCGMGGGCAGVYTAGTLWPKRNPFRMIAFGGIDARARRPTNTTRRIRSRKDERMRKRIVVRAPQFTWRSLRFDSL